ncbi:MAG: hypothetical protein WC319_08565 [Candidatus Paceibacterota bacterium]|jgi:hypothetical protein
MKKFIKGLLMALAALFADYSAGTFGTASYIVAGCLLVGYYAKNWWFPSVSEDGVFDWRDIASAVILALSVAIPESISQFIVDGAIVWKELFSVIIAVVGTYFTGTFLAKAKK